MTRPMDRLVKEMRIPLAILILVAGTSACDRSDVSHENASHGMNSSGASHTGPSKSWTETTASGRYRVSIRPETPPLTTGSLHAWMVRVETLDGDGVRPTALDFSGGMPQHGHGLDTSPEVTAISEDDEFRVDGVRFQMGGSWTLQVKFMGPAGSDVAVFEINVPH